MLVTTSLLPKLAYNTAMDNYMLLCLSFLVGCTLVHFDEGGRVILHFPARIFRRDSLHRREQESAE